MYLNIKNINGELIGSNSFGDIKFRARRVIIDSTVEIYPFKDKTRYSSKPLTGTTSKKNYSYAYGGSIGDQGLMLRLGHTSVVSQHSIYLVIR